MQTVYPVVPIREYGKAKDYYVNQLGFKIDWEIKDGDLPVFLQVTRDGQSLYLTQNPKDGEPPVSVYLYVPDVDAWCGVTQKLGMDAEEPPDEQPWGNREARYRDPFGNWLTVASRKAT
jgi:uncharacterized glyoxalase superfamily protein PhnB